MNSNTITNSMKLKQRAVTLAVCLVFMIISTLFLRLYLVGRSSHSASVVPRVIGSPLVIAASDSAALSVSHESPWTKPPARVKNRTQIFDEVKEVAAVPLLEKTWNMWYGWVRQDTFYPEDAFPSGQMWQLLKAMAEAPIVKLDVGEKGTQLKASVLLKGRQKALFKPRRYGLLIEW